MPYPSGTLYPSSTLFPSSLDGGQVFDGLIVQIGDLYLTGVDDFGCTWATDPSISGWDGSPGSSRQLTQKSRSAGAWSSPRSAASRSIVLPGKTWCPSPDAYQAATERLMAAVTLEDTVLTITRGTQTRSVICARQDEVDVSELSGSSLFSWSVQLGAADPRKFTTSMTASTGLPSASGGFSMPFTVPGVNTTNVETGIVALSNPGNAGGALLIRVDGPVVGPQITHIGASGLTQTVGLSLALNAGEYVVIDPTPDGQSVLAQGQPGASRGAFLTSTDWFSFDPGVNQFAFTAQSGSGLATITAVPAWL